MKLLGLLEDDPCLDFKLKAAAYLGLSTRILSQPQFNEVDGLLDCTSLSDAAQVSAATALLAPASILRTSECLPEIGKAIPYLPLRKWGIALAARRARLSGSCDEISSLRFSWLSPAKKTDADLAGQEDRFLNRLVEILDCAVFISGCHAEEVHVEKVEGLPIAFCLARLVGNVVVEIEFNEALPASARPVRQLKANFKEGAATNMPIVGLENEEGAVFLTDDGGGRLVIDDEDAPSFDEFENLYWKMLAGISSDTEYPDASQIYSLASALSVATEKDVPVSLLESGEVNPWSR